PDMSEYSKDHIHSLTGCFDRYVKLSEEERRAAMDEEISLADADGIVRKSVRKAGKGLWGGGFAVETGFSDSTVTSDPRYKLALRLYEQGIAGNKYASHMMKNYFVYKPDRIGEGRRIQFQQMKHQIHKFDGI
ncbi:hypothetical protein ADUPG1_003633, partial [Aduncisulcus paluster]